jgi:hypothetical protein
MNAVRPFAVLAVATAVMMPAGALAQYYGTAPQGAPLYPYAAQPNQPYAIEVTPGTYVIRRPQEARQRPYAEQSSRAHRAERSARKAMRNDPAVIEELRQRHAGKHGKHKIETEVVNTKKIVRGKPIVIETTRVVDDPPKVIVRKRYVDDTTASIPRGKQKVAIEEPAAPNSKRDDNKKRVIEADAEVTIIGSDRMSIRLFRKRGSAQAKASADAD